MDAWMLMNVLMVLTAVIRSAQTHLEATIVRVALAIVWHLTDKRVLVSPLSLYYCVMLYD